MVKRGLFAFTNPPPFSATPRFRFSAPPARAPSGLARPRSGLAPGAIPERVLPPASALGPHRTLYKTAGASLDTSPSTVLYCPRDPARCALVSAQPWPPIVVPFPCCLAAERSALHPFPPPSPTAAGWKWSDIDRPSRLLRAIGGPGGPTMAVTCSQSPLPHCEVQDEAPSHPWLRGHDCLQPQHQLPVPATQKPSRPDGRVALHVMISPMLQRQVFRHQ